LSSRRLESRTLVLTTTSLDMAAQVLILLLTYPKTRDFQPQILYFWPKNFWQQLQLPPWPLSRRYTGYINVTDKGRTDVQLTTSIRRFAFQSETQWQTINQWVEVNAPRQDELWCRSCFVCTRSWESSATRSDWFAACHGRPEDQLHRHRSLSQRPPCPGDTPEHTQHYINNQITIIYLTIITNSLN